MKKALFLLLQILISGSQILRGEEGMWIPLLIERYHIEEMQEAGLKLKAEDIYSINQACLKDAIVIFGGGCTGEMISGEGLLLTNHHCGEGAIQSHSSVEHDYLSNGFWAMSREEELPNLGLTATYLRYMQDVTQQVSDRLEQGMDPQERQQRINQNMGAIIREATEGTHLDADVTSFYYGNAYYLFVYEKFTDVRLVGAPPSSIGNFGGDTDNWIWPRHTGDFALFRVYASKDNQPADYSPDNVPYKPLTHLEVNLGGIRDGDFTMILGYPSSTTQYLHSDVVRYMLESSLHLKIGLRTTRLEIMDAYMRVSDEVRIQYSHKYRRVSNSWKMWQGMILGLERNKAVQQKVEEESAFQLWVDQDDERIMKYGDLLAKFRVLNREMDAYSLSVDLYNESVMAIELFTQLRRVRQMMVRGAARESIEREMDQFFKDYYLPVDRDIFTAMMKAYQNQMPVEYHPAFFDRLAKKHRNDFGLFAEKIYAETLFSDRKRCQELLDIYTRDSKKAVALVEEDPMTVCLEEFNTIYKTHFIDQHRQLDWEEEELYRSYMAGLLEMADDKPLYPDANQTMRLSYGSVKGYRPRDGVEYFSTTTMKGMIEKSKAGHADYMIPDKLVSLYEAKDYGPYGVDGTMPVCFIASNHTSGGNSGSPVLDGSGRLIGLNFDREWEGTMSDQFYDPELCRNIAVDIRYVLFIIDKFAGAGYLVDEMDVIP
jgi:hypothetical protein